MRPSQKFCWNSVSFIFESRLFCFTKVRKWRRSADFPELNKFVSLKCIIFTHCIIYDLTNISLELLQSQPLAKIREGDLFPQYLSVPLNLRPWSPQTQVAHQCSQHGSCSRLQFTYVQNGQKWLILTQVPFNNINPSSVYLDDCCCIMSQSPKLSLSL